MRCLILTRSKETECAIIIIFVDIGQNVSALSTDLLIGTEDDHLKPINSILELGSLRIK